MDQFFEFIANHWLLSGTFAALLVAFFVNEVKRSGQSISSQQLVNLVNQERAVVLDVRDNTEYAAGHITDAINIPHASLQSRMNELEKYKERPIVVVCKMGQHAGSMGTLLKKAGFKQVSRLRGGLSAWQAENLPLIKGRA
ncbi:MAG: rhodanese-like domain-containing protein [Gammaproteobacteria bacterium]|nr:rhodanese-like domain-containing protein [Gammaproteobacteria bacterium]